MRNNNEYLGENHKCYGFSYMMEISPTVEVIEDLAKGYIFTKTEGSFVDWVEENYNIISSVGLKVSEKLGEDLQERFPYLERLSRGRTKVSIKNTGVAISLYYKYAGGNLVESVSVSTMGTKVTTRFKHTNARVEFDTTGISNSELLFSILSLLYQSLLRGFVLNHNLVVLNSKLKTNGGYQVKLVRTASGRLVNLIRQDYLELKISEKELEKITSSEELLNAYNSLISIPITEFDVLHLLKDASNGESSLKFLVHLPYDSPKRYKAVSVLKEEITERNDNLRQSSVMVRTVEEIDGDQKLCIYEKGYNDLPEYTKVLQIDLTTNDIDRLVL